MNKFKKIIIICPSNSVALAKKFAYMFLAFWGATLKVINLV